MTGSNGNGNDCATQTLLSHDHRLDLTDKVAVVTGGANGIGRATCLGLAENGVRAIAVVDQMDDVNAVTSDTNDALGRQVMVPFRGDVTCGDFRRHVFSEMSDLHGPVSICVPAAGFTADRLAVKVDRESGETDLYPEETFKRVLDVDLTAPIYWGIETIASVARDRHARGIGKWQPKERVQGCIIFIGSVSSAGNRGQVSYAAAKAGLEGAQATLSAEAMYHGVRCAVIHPGFTDTGMVRALGEKFIEEHVIPQTQLRRLIKPEEIADAICFMIRNSTVSGQLWADAGWHPNA
jgi:3-oxoacyl-[acyl-carrier protein] reductase